MKGNILEIPSLRPISCDVISSLLGELIGKLHEADHMAELRLIPEMGPRGMGPREW